MSLPRRHTLDRTAFTTSRTIEFFTTKELTIATGAGPDRWPEIVAKELIDNALDAAESAGILPDVTVVIDHHTITVSDNGPGLPPAILARVLDFGSRTSTKDSYISPSRGQQGNALQTIAGIMHVLGGGQPQRLSIRSQGRRHTITVSLDRIAQAPTITHHVAADATVKKGTVVAVPLARSDADTSDRFLPLVAAYGLFNPHVTFALHIGTALHRFTRTAPTCRKWRSSDPTSAHWYTVAQLRGLMASYVTSERRGGRALFVRDFVGQFRGLSSTVKRKAILAKLPTLAALSLSACVTDGDIDETIVAKLLRAMQQASRPIKPVDLGVLGQAHLQAWLLKHGGVAATFAYKRIADVDTDTGLPFVFEFCFGARQDDDGRRLFVGLNSAPALTDPFRMLKDAGLSLGALLSEQYLGPAQPVTIIAHLACPHLRYTDRGKSSLEAL